MTRHQRHELGIGLAVDRRRLQRREPGAIRLRFERTPTRMRTHLDLKDGHVSPAASPPSSDRPSAQARFSCAMSKGSARSRLPVAAKIALATAGAIGGVPGSPMPPGASVLGRMCTSTRGISFMRISG